MTSRRKSHLSTSSQEIFCCLHFSVWFKNCSSAGTVMLTQSASYFCSTQEQLVLPKTHRFSSSSNRFFRSSIGWLYSSAQHASTSSPCSSSISVKLQNFFPRVSGGI